MPGHTEWKPGQSGNPNGRPLKNRALTEILERAGNITIPVQGTTKKSARKRLVAESIWELVSTGKATLPDGSTLSLEPGDWLGLVKWIYAHIDGPPKSEMDLTSGGDKIVVTLVSTSDD